MASSPRASPGAKTRVGEKNLAHVHLAVKVGWELGALEQLLHLRAHSHTHTHARTGGETSAASHVRAGGDRGRGLVRVQVWTCVCAGGGEPRGVEEIGGRIG